MAVKLFAAIYVGSSEVGMKIYEVNAKKGIRIIDSVKNIIELGRDTYSKGYLSAELINETCDILNKFKKKMKEYRVTEYRAYATSAVREAQNAMMAVEAIRVKTDIRVEILSNSEQRFISYKGMVYRMDDLDGIIEKNAALVDIGAGSIQISLFDKKNMIVTQNIPIGTVRIRDYLAGMVFDAASKEKIIEDFVENDIVTFRNLYLNDKEIKSVIAIGEPVQSLQKLAGIKGEDSTISRDDLDKIYDKIVNSTPEELAVKYGIPYERATLILANVVIYKLFLNNSKAEKIYLPNVDFYDGIVAEYVNSSVRNSAVRNFEEDIIASANNLAKRYRCNRVHSAQIEAFAVKIFDAMAKIYDLTDIQRLQLRIAAILHECGNYINMHDGAINSYNIIAGTEMIGLSHRERMEVANIVKYTFRYLPPYNKITSELETCNYITISELAAILRIANILDKSHRQKIKNVSAVVKAGKLIITVNTFEDFTLEAGLFESRAEFFEQVFGLVPQLKVKRSAEK